MELQKNPAEKRRASKEEIIKFHFSSLISQLGELPRTIRTQTLTDRTADLFISFVAVLRDFEDSKNAYLQDN